MPNDPHNSDHNHGDLSLPIWVDSCKIVAHAECSESDCEVKGIGESISDAQIKVGIATAVSGVVISTAYALGILGIWLWHAAHGNNMPDIPMVITSIAMTPFAAGAIAMRIPGKAAIKRITSNLKKPGV